jgi:hypothetical protein
MIVAAEHEVHLHLGERAEGALRVLEPVTLRELAFHRVVVHHDDAEIAGGRSREHVAQTLDLRAADDADDRESFIRQVSDCPTTPCDVLRPANVAPGTRSTGSMSSSMYRR